MPHLYNINKQYFWYIVFYIFSLLSFSSCDSPLKVEDNAFKCSVEVLNPQVGYGERARIRVFVNHSSVSIKEVKCEETLFWGADGDEEITLYDNLNISGKYFDLSTAELMPTYPKTVKFSITLVDGETGAKEVLKSFFQELTEDIILPYSITLNTENIEFDGSSSSLSAKTARLTYEPASCIKDLSITPEKSELFTVSVSTTSLAFRPISSESFGTEEFTISSEFDPNVYTKITITRKKDICMVIMGQSNGTKGSSPYDFKTIYTFLSDYSGTNITSKRNPRTIYDLNLNDLKVNPNGCEEMDFPYTIEWEITNGGVTTNLIDSRKGGTDLSSCSNLLKKVNSDNDRADKSDQTKLSQYFFKVSSLSYDSPLYNIKYIIHAYKGHDDREINNIAGACKHSSESAGDPRNGRGGYYWCTMQNNNLRSYAVGEGEKSDFYCTNRYWYAAIDYFGADWIQLGVNVKR